MWKREASVSELVRQLDRYTERKDWDDLSREERLNLLQKGEWEAVKEQQQWCTQDFTYAARNYFWITDNNGQDMLLDLWEAQYLILQLWYDLKSQGRPQKIYIIKGRQVGASVLVEAMIAWSTIFFPNTEALVVSVDQPHASYLFSLMLHIYDRLPWWMKPELASREEKDGLWFDRKDPEKRATKPGLNSHIYVQWSTQFSGVGQGRKILALHGSEITDWYQPRARTIIESDLGHALKDTPRAFGFLETTGKEAGSYSHRLWRKCENMAELADWYPLFIPWFFEPSRKRTITFGWAPKKPELSMRERIKGEWVRCIGCGRYTGASQHGMSRDGTHCPFCKTGVLAPVTLTDEQLFWKEAKRRNAEGTDSESYKEHLQELACVHGDSRVSTELGILPIGNRANVGEECESGQVVRWIDQGERDTVKITTKFGRELICTTNQLIMLIDRSRASVKTKFGSEMVEVVTDEMCHWKPADELDVGDIIKLTPPRFSEKYASVRWNDPPAVRQSIFVDERLGKFLGYFMGDGCWKNNCVEIACDRKDQDVVSDITRACEKIIGSRPRVYESSSHQMTLVDSSNIKWAPVLKQIGAIEQWHDNAWGWKRRVCVPECIWRSPRTVVKAFLSALFECDGHAYKETPRTTFFTMHDQFAKDVQLLLLGFGINAEIRQANKINGEGREYTGREVVIRGEGSNRFHSEIGFISNRKRTSGMIKSRSRSPYADGIDFVKSVVPYGPQHVYDLTTEDKHLFSANGITVHNSTAEEAFQLHGLAVFGVACQERVNATIRDPDKFPGVKVGYFDYYKQFHGLDGSRPVLDYEGATAYRCYRESCNVNHMADLEDFNVIIWEDPQDGCAYSVGVDIAEGIGQDYSVIFVNKFGQFGMPDEQVAVLRDNHMEPMDLAFYCDLIGHMYNDALMCIEYNGIGKVCADHVLRTYDYPNIFRWKHMDSVHVQSNKFHWYTKPDTREKLWQTARKWIKAGSWVIRSKNFLAEMQDFQKDEDDSKNAGHSDGGHDDELMAGMIALYAGHEGEADDRGTIRCPMVEDVVAAPRFQMICKSCGHEWPASNPEYNSQCISCYSHQVIGKPLETFDNRATVGEVGFNQDGSIVLSSGKGVNYSPYTLTADML